MITTLLFLALPLVRLSDAFASFVHPTPSALSRFSRHGASSEPRRPWHNDIPNYSNRGAAAAAGSETIHRSTATSGSSSSEQQPSLMSGTSTFETWYKSVGGKCADGLRHAAFRNGSLRGLEFDGKATMRGAIQLPEKLVLRADYNRNSKEGQIEEDWDSKLAVMLVKECAKGTESDLYGYCSLLTRDVPFDSVPAPPPTAPDALRHWTSAQLARLKRSETGERLVDASKKQTKRWAEKYESLPPEDRDQTTREQFLWAMEAVHSRAFRGNFGGGLLNSFQKLTVPFVAAAFGLIVLLANDSETADLIAQICGLLVLGPAFLGMVEEGGQMGPGSGRADAVLLPFIDSANHDERAESNIEYDPVNGVFDLDLGRNCLKEEDGRTQLYISYGMRSDKELLLNYGFLPGIGGGGEGTSGGGGGEPIVDEDKARDRQRARLAEEFLRRNP